MREQSPGDHSIWKVNDQERTREGELQILCKNATQISGCTLHCTSTGQRASNTVRAKRTKYVLHLLPITERAENECLAKFIALRPKN